ncbi:glycoside hydrolase family 19 protein [Cupriavidus pauculus]|uniref:Chitinase n=1 Tax=Cupriavidus pauculus TaxID=82633 RepID=A0A3G8H2X7_9BURK|nr:glycoside hydrolase family 19 protein [Cupriavidus pauculus]AZG14754.1 chitinase [Cupriavidus pauculus]
MTQTPPNPDATRVRQLAFAFPFCRKGDGQAAGRNFTSEHDFHTLLKKEPSGCFAVGPKGMWHGGIHVSESGAGASLDLLHGVRCMADGEVVAFRINRAYLVSQVAAQDGKPEREARYSTGFVLVRHAMEFPKGNRLTFFSLYMHLQDLAGYDSDPKLPRPGYWRPDFKVTPFASDRPTGRPRAGAPDQVGLRVRATQLRGTPLCLLPHGARIRIGKRQGHWGQIEDTHGAQLIPASVGGRIAPAGAVGGWVFLGEERGHRVIEEVMPEAQLDRVVTPATPIPIRAGELVGHLGRYDPLRQPAEHRMVHLEVFCDDRVQSFLEKSRAWVESHGHKAGEWKKLGLSSEPTLLRVDQNTRLYRQPFRAGAESPRTDVIQTHSFAELERIPDNKRMETEPVEGGKQPWWRIRSVDFMGRGIEGWVRQRDFAGGRVTPEFAQTWPDFDATLKAPHDAAHTIFASATAYVDYAMGADVVSPGAVDKLSPLMVKVHRAIYPKGDGSRAADELCATMDDPSRAFRSSRLIIRHESEWANPGKWQALLKAIEQRTGPQPEHDEEQRRIGKLAWWDEVKAGVSDLPGPNVFHIHPIGLVGNFHKTLICKACGADIALTNEFLSKIAPGAHDGVIQELIIASRGIFANYGLNSCRQVTHFLGQAKHETQGFRLFRESLLYRNRTAEALYQLARSAIEAGFKRKGLSFSSQEEKISWVQENLVANEEGYADHCFGSDEQPGKDFRGRGLLHLTHYENYKRCGRDIGYPIDESPELVEKDGAVIVESGLWFWKYRRIGRVADNPMISGDVAVKDVTRRINPGYAGLAERQRFKREISLVFREQYSSSRCEDD